MDGASQKQKKKEKKRKKRIQEKIENVKEFKKAPRPDFIAEVYVNLFSFY